ncbi:aminotransferase class I/II-fold pyridoxal phosphate-dependent enzyme [Paenibacillus melissococcoides]|uniref:Aminotransferase class I/II-fold pyridoxal phosphate-dependent enzyme n=1 Tax=Paenibacillus melissococcoides TaxID=2912268 RepID=A0ABM9FWC2_9BACL|nr:MULTISPECIES: aminotransferase class I/II-fold pyridoxal phosphate-dependent enzyme [Paenibacillus]MEB9893554.1 aminotransferase class I/II-fold pyridoxal phosphate-dependent enzyme [Bacillus cereus]CAH8243272.1 aminotransferase class I/II-fold pyridoxal phosphate-dependent enzyme [Paenibacillus melissococcoides]CAH8704087.1 aminotransferase class I/II-fold pyridoxal phosphate-dependent enzyme [Paenibacillus melissococcoides]CAH8707291.1 aminotransferase class I/II-fold pyridoxal phosphate-d
MNPLAQQLNDTIQRDNPNIHAMLSRLGRQIYFPKEGILSQSAEAGSKAKQFNATIGIATEGGIPMHLDVIQETLSAYNPKDIYPYAPPAGKPELRKLWKEKMIKENPSLADKHISMPIATNALTHGLSIVADLFAEEGDVVIMPDKNWENYELTFSIRRGAEMVYYPLYDDNWKFNSAGLRDALFAHCDKGKAIVVLNFPNNPTGYTPGREEGQAIVKAILEAAEAGMRLVVVTDDAYFGLFFEDSMHESLFSSLASLHPNVLPVKVDGATKEEYVWGFRVGFITYAAESEALLAALEQKTMGIIRATISSGPHPSQTFVLHALQSPEFEAQKQEKYRIMKARANKVKALLDSGKYGDVWSYYPFNSGYFMCLKLNTVPAEQLRTHLLDAYGVGTIALGDTDLRVAFSCIEEADLEKLFDTIYQGVLDISQ